MTINNIRKELIDLAQKEKPANKIAKILAFYYPNLNLNDKKSLFESIFYYYKISNDNDFEFGKIIEHVETDNSINGFVGSDFRIKSFEISNLRGIPDKDEKGIPFGMNLYEEGTIKNAIILANNGTGKSSIFAGLEMIYAQQIGEKQLRTKYPDGLEKKDYDGYLRRFPNDLKPSCIIHTNEGDFSLDNIIFKDKTIRNKFNPFNHFISDFDIYHYGQITFDGKAEDSNSFHSIIANSLGLGEYIRFGSILKELKAYRRTTERLYYNKLVSQQLDTKKNIVTWEYSIENKTQELSVLRKKNTINEIGDIRKKKIDKFKKLSNENLTYNLDKRLYESSISEFNKAFQENQSIEKNEKLTLEKDFLEMGVELIHEFDSCPFCQDSKKSLTEIQLEVEIRLRNLKELQNVEEELKKSHKNLMQNLFIFSSETQKIYNVLSKERTEISVYRELDTLLDTENQLYNLLSKIIDENELFNNLIELTQIPYPKENDIKRIFNFLNKYKKIFSEPTPTYILFIDAFIKYRETFLHAAIESLTKNEIEDSAEKQIAIIEEDIVRLKLQVEAGKKQVGTLEPQIEAANIDAELVDTIKTEVDDYLPGYIAFVNKLVNEAFDPIKIIVETILREYLQDEKGLTLIIDKKEVKSIVDGEEVINNNIVAIIEYCDNESGEKKIITPDLYFNTFRYKLFCLMVSLSLALATRIKYNINLPLIMDDLFYASDFINKHSFSRFIIHVINLFYKYTPNLPLQFIMFTHDDLIFKSAIDSLDNFSTLGIELNSLCEENKIHMVKKTIIGRIFKPDSNDKKPKKFENNELFWDLLYKLPQEILN